MNAGVARVPVRHRLASLDMVESPDGGRASHPKGVPAVDLPDLDPHEAYRRLVRRWTLPMAVALLGAALGWWAALARPPLYRASAAIGADLDPGRVWVVDEDIARLTSLHVRDLLLSDEVLLAALDGDVAVRTGSGRALDALRDTIRIEERTGRWDLVVIDTDPDRAAERANRWADAALESLETAARHAWRVAELQGAWSQIACRLESSPEATGSTVWVCRLAGSEAEAADLLDALMEEIRLGRGIPPALTFYSIQEAAPHDRPEVGGRGVRTAAGALAGLIVGAVAAVAWSPRRRR